MSPSVRTTARRSAARLIFTLCTVQLGGAAGAAGNAAEAERSHLPANEDLRHVRAMGEPQLSPDGRSVLVQITDATADGARKHLWLVDIARDTVRQLTSSPDNDPHGETSGRWMANGDVCFTAKRGEHTQLFRLPMAGGDAVPFDLKVVPVVDTSADADSVPPQAADAPASGHELVPVDVQAFQVAPLGPMIAIVARDPETPGEKKQRDAKADAVLEDHDRHGSRLYLLAADTGKLTATAVPPNLESVAWSRGGDRLIAISEGPNHASDLAPSSTAWLVSVDAPEHPTQLHELPSALFGGAWSDDGQRYYFASQAGQDAPPAYPDLYVLSFADRSIRNLTAGMAGSPAGPPIPAAHGVLLAAQMGTGVGYVRLQDGKREVLRFEAPFVSQLQTNTRRTGWVWLGSSASQPNTLYYTDRLDRAARVLKTPTLLAPTWTQAPARVLRWQSDGQPIEGLLYLPPQAAGGKFPLVVDVHGGPTGAWLDSFDPLPGFLLAQGWAVLRPNPRGSSGYGAAFAAANKNDLGGGDYRDIIAGVDAALAGYPLDADRLALIGYSYGGEMAGFVEGRSTRFRAIVSGAPVIDQQSEYGTEDSSEYDRWFFGKPWEHAEDAWRQSPLAGAARASAPFLLLQGEGDTVDPLGQSLEMYRALRQENVPVQLVRYPRENHGPLYLGLHGGASEEPWHGYDARQRLVRFIHDAFAAGREPAAAGRAPAHP